MKKYDGKTFLTVLLAVALVVLMAFSVAGITGKGTFSNLFRGKCVSNGYQCGDCIDNDGDGLIDYKVNKKGVVTGDPDCTSLTDNTESSCIPACYRNSDCGTNGYVGNTSCGTDGNVYRDYTTYTCYNAGQCSSSCDSQTDSFLWQMCGNSTICSNGTCI